MSSNSWRFNYREHCFRIFFILLSVFIILFILHLFVKRDRTIYNNCGVKIYRIDDNIEIQNNSKYEVNVDLLNGRHTIKNIIEAKSNKSIQLFNGVNTLLMESEKFSDTITIENEGE